MKSVLDRIERIQFKDRVRTAAGARRYGQPIGSIIRRDRNGNILKPLASVADDRSAATRARDKNKSPKTKKPAGTAKKVPGTPNDTPIKGHTSVYEEPDEDGYEVVTDGKRRKYYIAQDEDGTWGAWDAKDNFIAEGSDHKVLLKNLDEAVASPTPKGMHRATVEERQKLVTPPDWRDVFIADDLDSAYVLSKGFDSKGRGQAQYAADYRQQQDAAKFARMKKLAKQVGSLDAALAKDAMKDDDAAAVLLMRALGMRPGSTKDTGADVPTYGATTLLGKHVTVRGDTTTLEFIPGKKKVPVTIKLKDPLVARVMEERLKTRKRNTPIFDTNERKATEYFQKQGMKGFKLKDLRTLKANEIAFVQIKKKRGTPKSKAEFRRWRREVATEVSNVLGNTPTIALSGYINPVLFDKWLVNPDWA